MKLAPSLQKIKKTLDRVLFESDDPIVIAIKGRWGTGKTYFWQNIIVKNRPSNKIGYVSVFGAESIQNIREKVVLAALPIPDTINNSENKLVSKVREYGSSVLNYFPDIVRKIGVPDKMATEILEKQLLKKGWVLCIDDVERLSEIISADMLLGYITELRDKWNIKVVLIYNPEKFGKENKQYFEKYHEKVIDRQLPFIPDTKEIVELVFESSDLLKNNTKFITELSRRVKLLNLSNIRVLVKVRHYYTEVISALPNNSEQDFKENVLFSLLLFVWVNFYENDELIDFELLSSYSELSNRLMLDSINDEDERAKTESAFKTLSEYGYAFTDDLDRLLIELISTDVLDQEKLIEEYEKDINNISLGKLEKRFRDVWGTYYHGSFQDTEEKFCSELEAAVEDYIEFIDINNLDSALYMFQKLEKSEISIRLLQLYKDKQGEKLVGFNLSSLVRRIKFDRLREYLEQVDEVSKQDNRTINEVIDSVFENNYYSSADREKLSMFSSEEIFNYFENLKGEKVTRKLKHVYELTLKTSSPEGYELMIQTKMREVIDRLAAQSTINDLRMESMGLIPSSE